MEGDDTVTESRRLYIGNISTALADKKEALLTRISKFGEITSDLELRKKATFDHFFGYVNIKVSKKGLKQLRSAFNGAVFMGSKLRIEAANEVYQERWRKDQQSADKQKDERLKREKIHFRREERINEASTRFPHNSMTKTLVTTNSTLDNSALGYSKSPHTFNDISGNVKHKPPTHTLVGKNSYGALTFSKGYPNNYQYSRTSGRAEVIEGRHRITKRPNHYILRKQHTLRILINGELKTLKSYKTKLWGLEKNKTLRDLTYRYINGVWESGDHHILERVEDSRKLVSGTSSSHNLQVFDSAPGASINEKPGSESKNENFEFEEEHDKNKNILASLFGTLNFDKPIDIEENNGIDEQDIVVDSKGRRTVQRYDYENEGELEESDLEIDQSDIEKGLKLLEEHQKSESRPPQEVYFDEDDEEEEGDNVRITSSNEQPALENPKIEPEDSASLQNDSEENDHEDEFIPSFGAPPAVKSSENKTEALRTLFNPSVDSEKRSGFSLALSEEDDDLDEIEVSNEKKEERLLKEIKAKQEDLAKRTPARKSGLFWTHSDSPFLSNQTQLNRLGVDPKSIKLPGESDEISLVGSNGESPYETWFWQSRGELFRECKRRERDLNRSKRKKSGFSTI